MIIAVLPPPGNTCERGWGLLSLRIIGGREPRKSWTDVVVLMLRGHFLVTLPANICVGLLELRYFHGVRPIIGVQGGFDSCR